MRESVPSENVVPPWYNQAMFDFPVVIVDIETTGLSPRGCKIIEVSALRVENGEIVESLTSLVNPHKHIPEFISSLTNITGDLVREAPDFDDLAPRLASLFEGAAFMAHNAYFDFSFISKEMKTAGYPFNPKIICSVKLSRKLYPQYKAHSLAAIIKRHGISTSRRHRAHADAMAVYDFLHIAREEKGSDALDNAVALQFENSTLPSNLDKSTIKNLVTTPGVYIFKDTHGVPIYIGKSVNIKHRVLSHFSQSKTHGRELRLAEKTHDIEVIETDTEIEALLLESKLIKEYAPVHNIKLRRKRKQTVVVCDVNKQGYYELKIVDAHIDTLDQLGNVFGIFNTRSSAKTALQSACDEYGLCSKLLHLENAQQSCFRYQLGKCDGACVGDEPPAEYNARVEEAFANMRIKNWDYAGPVEVSISETRKLVVDQWLVLDAIGLGTNYDADIQLDFDVDAYKILKSYFDKYPDRIKIAS